MGIEIRGGRPLSESRPIDPRGQPITGQGVHAEPASPDLESETDGEIIRPHAGRSQLNPLRGRPILSAPSVPGSVGVLSGRATGPAPVFTFDHCTFGHCQLPPGLDWWRHFPPLWDAEVNAASVQHKIFFSQGPQPSRAAGDDGWLRPFGSVCLGSVRLSLFWLTVVRDPCAKHSDSAVMSRQQPSVKKSAPTG
jgi:hypothetical protein